MRNAFVAWHGDLRLDPGSSSYSKFHVVDVIGSAEAHVAQSDAARQAGISIR